VINGNFPDSRESRVVDQVPRRHSTVKDGDRLLNVITVPYFVIRGAGRFCRNSSSTPPYRLSLSSVGLHIIIWEGRGEGGSNERPHRRAAASKLLHCTTEEDPPFQASRLPDFPVPLGTHPGGMSIGCPCQSKLCLVSGPPKAPEGTKDAARRWVSWILI
jgi:hypothetical protein